MEQSDAAGSNTIGPLMASLYLSLRGGANAEQIDLYAIAEALQACEEHIPDTSRNETAEIVTEIVQDCRKKAAPILRTPFTESLRISVASTRKKLIAKTGNKDIDPGYKHGERHFHLLMELLGGWSNTIVQISNLGLSLPTFHAVASPMHSHVVDCAVECFQQFKKDKKLDSWHERVMNSTTVTSSNQIDDGTGTFSIITLDSIVVQVASMREVIGKYYSFVDNFSFDVLNNNDSGTTASSALYPEQELRQWRELDMIYISLESGYLSHALQEALQEQKLIQVQTGIYVPQVVEDFFFIFSRVIDRSMSTSVDSIMLAIAMKMIMYIDFDPLAGDEDDSRPICQLLNNKYRFLGSYRSQSITKFDQPKPREIKGGLNTKNSMASGSEVKATESALPPGGVMHVSSPRTSAASKGSSNNLKAVVGDDLGEELGALAEMTGINKLMTSAGESGWFAALSSAAQGLTESPPLSNGSSVGVTRTHGSKGNLQDQTFIAGGECDVGGSIRNVSIDQIALKNNGGSGPSTPAPISTGSGGGISARSNESGEVGLQLDPLLFYDQFHYNRDGSYKTMLSVISTVAEVVTADDVYERLYRIPRNAEDSALEANPFSLSLADWAVSFNACTATISSINKLQKSYEAYMVDQITNNSKTLDMICSELRRVGTMHEELLHADMTAIFWESFDKHLAQPISMHARARKDIKNVPAPNLSWLQDRNSQLQSNSSGFDGLGYDSVPKRFCITYTCVNYEIDGETMEKYSNNSSIVRLVNDFIYNATYDSQGKSVVTDQGGSGAHANITAESDKKKAIVIYGTEEGGKDAEKRVEERGYVSVLSYYLRPYCSSEAYTSVINIFAGFFSRHLLFEAIVSMQYSEWGALLFQKEVYGIIQVFENAIDVVNADDTSGGDGSGTGAPRSPAGPGANKGLGFDNGSIRAQFGMMLWIVKLLSLDRLGDVGRYKIPLSIFAPYENDMNAIMMLVQRRTSITMPGATITERFIRIVLTRRKGFQLESIAKAKLQLI
jgi:hypothetical protein